MKILLDRINTPALITVVLVTGHLALAAVDAKYRPSFASLAQTGLTAYLGAMTLGQSKSSAPD